MRRDTHKGIASNKIGKNAVCVAGDTGNTRKTVGNTFIILCFLVPTILRVIVKQYGRDFGASMRADSGFHLLMLSVLRNDILLYVCRHLFVLCELHGERAAPLRDGAQVGCVV